MGIYDRDYYRREGPSYLETLIPSGQVCKWLIAVNIAIFLVQVLTDRPPVAADFKREDGHFVLDQHGRPVLVGPTFTQYLYLDPGKVMSGEVWRLVTYAFLHDVGAWTHIFFNMLFLWWFGSELERMYGPKEFLAFYLVAALAGGLGGFGLSLATKDMTPTLGASGAVTALLVLFAMHFPHQRVYLFLLVPIPVWALVVFQVAQDCFGAFRSLWEVQKTAFVVHLAGALFGFVYYKQHWQILSLLRSLQFWKGARARPRLRLYRPEPHEEAVPVATAPPSVLDEHLEAKLDAVLEKVARFGQASLTDAERQILLKASEIYKRNRS